jgi:inosine-uridine nucleoside N-ribohydrolase
MRHVHRAILLIGLLPSITYGQRGQERPRATAAAIEHRVIIDTDAGPDDLMAIAFLVGRPDVRVAGIVVETGLTRVQAGAANVLRLLHVAHQDSVPVFIGAARHLQPTVAFPPAWIESSEQLGAAAAGPAIRKPETGSATDFLVSALTNARAVESHTELLALGPLTNVALAIRAAGRGRIQPIRVVIMGGALDVPGNLVTPDTKSDNTRAEWNVFSDPLAAREVLGSPLRTEWIALDATRHVLIDSLFVRSLASGTPTPTRRYVGHILHASREWVGRGDYCAWDPLAAVALVDPRAVQLDAVKISIDVDGKFPGWTRRDPRGRDTRVATNGDRPRFMRAFDAGLGGMRASNHFGGRGVQRPIPIN